MGTSSSYPGPSGIKPLLPPWADEAADQDNEDLRHIPDVSWRAPKAALSRMAHGSTTTRIKSVAQSYVRASGGSHTAAAAAQSGRIVTGHLANMLSTGISNGFAQAARQLGLGELRGRDADFVLASFVDLLAPDGALLEEAAARRATIVTMVELFAQCDVEAGGVEALNSLDAEGVKGVITLFVINYVDARLQQVLVSRIERGALTEQDANNLLMQMREYIAGIVQLDFTDIDVATLDWQGAEGQRRIERFYQDAYSVLGDEE